MNLIKFPSINLELYTSKIAFSVFGIGVYKYAICIVLGAILGLIFLMINSKIINYKYEDLIEKYVVTLIIGIIGARVFFVLFRFDDYKNNLLQILYIRDGGLAIFGGLIFGFLYLFLTYRKDKDKLFDILDLTAPSVSIAQCIGRWGNFFNIEAYGTETTSFLRMGINTINGYIEVHPTFLYESIATLLIFIVLEIILRRRKYKGQVVITYCFLYSASRSVIEGLRVDSLMIGAFRVSQILSIIVLIFSLILIVKNSRKMSYEKTNKY